jgi:RimJ/RimL family protein N-acetyltransferase
VKQSTGTDKGLPSIIRLPVTPRGCQSPPVTEIDAENLVLRLISRDVAAALLDGRVPEGVVFASGYPSPFSLEVMDLVAGPRSAKATGPSFFIVRKADDAVVGEIGYHLDADSSMAQVGYSLVEPCWGRGYATDALRALLMHLRAEVGVRRVVAETLVGHTASRRVMEKAGMHQCGARVGEVDGETMELVVYELA